MFPECSDFLPLHWKWSAQAANAHSKTNDGLSSQKSDERVAALSSTVVESQPRLDQAERQEFCHLLRFRSSKENHLCI